MVKPGSRKDLCQSGDSGPYVGEPCGKFSQMNLRFPGGSA